jgi:ribosomal protein S18 acetylase RimI-like enzyme
MGYGRFADEDGVREYSDEVALIAAFDVVRQLRPHLDDVYQWLDIYRRQAKTGYRVLLLIKDNKPAAMAGFRIQENLIHGRFLYVDDLVTDAAYRGKGLGEKLLSALIELTENSSCERMVLDTAMANHDAQRFYLRFGLTPLATRFVTPHKAPR